MEVTKFSKTVSRKTVMSVAVVAMFVATMAISNVDAADSQVILDVDATSKTVMVGQSVSFTVELDSKDTRHRQMEVYMVANWPGGTAWGYSFKDSNGDPLPNNVARIDKGGAVSITFTVTCDEPACSSGDQNEVQIYGKPDPKFYPGSSRTNDGDNKCGSDDCETDTKPASSSGNTTNVKILTITAATAQSSTVVCDTELSDGGNQLYQGETGYVDYTITNTGFEDDSYTFATTISSSAGAPTTGFVLNTGLSNGKVLIGTSSSTGESSAESRFSVAVPEEARPGTYTVEFIASSVNGGADQGCSVSIFIPQPDLEILNTDITFSHNSAWINTNDNSQVVKIYVKVRNNGGTIDSSGARTNNVEVKIYIDGAQLGSVITVDSLAHGQEVPLDPVEWQPARAYDEDNEVGLSVVVKVDPSDKIEEIDEDNNQGTQYFKVIRAKSSAPSFFVGFFALISAIAVAVMLSSYYRNKDSE